MYKYNKKAHARFLKVPELCYLLLVFSVHPHAKELTARKLEAKPVAFQNRILSIITSLAKEALVSLHEAEHSPKGKVYLSLTRVLQQHFP